MDVGALALAVCGAYVAIAIYIAVVVHPARLALDTGTMLAQWRASEPPSFKILVSLAIFAAGCGMCRAWATVDWAWIVGVVLMLSLVPYALLVQRPINRSLREMNSNSATIETFALLRTWSRIHHGRLAISSLALASFAYRQVLSV